MTLRRSFHVTDDGRIDGLRVIGFQGAVDPTSTPAQRAPVLVDGELRLSRVVDYRTGLNGTEALVESVEPPLPADGALPGVATRFERSFPAMVEGVVAILGKSERPLVYKIDVERPDLPSRVAELLHWLRDDPKLAVDAPFDRPGEGMWACYLPLPERHALWRVLNPEVFASLRNAVRSDDPERMIADAFWLSRVVVHTENDLFKAAYALRCAGSPYWKPLLREGLRLDDEGAWERGLKEAAYAFGDHRDAPSQPQRRHRARDAVRQGAATR